MEDHTQWWQEKSRLYGLTAQGQTTWHGFAQGILAHASLLKKPLLIAINTVQSTQDYPFVVIFLVDKLNTSSNPKNELN